LQPLLRPPLYCSHCSGHLFIATTAQATSLLQPLLRPPLYCSHCSGHFSIAATAQATSLLQPLLRPPLYCSHCSGHLSTAATAQATSLLQPLLGPPLYCSHCSGHLYCNHCSGPYHESDHLHWLCVPWGKLYNSKMHRILIKTQHSQSLKHNVQFQVLVLLHSFPVYLNTNRPLSMLCTMMVPLSKYG
jgi:hypothetical protein